MKTLKAMWEGVKKLPGWAVLAFLFLGSVCWWLIQSLITNSAIQKIQKERVEVEKEHKESIEAIRDTESKEAKKITEKYKEKQEEIDEKEKELFKSVSKGPTEIAKEWQKFLGGKND